MALRTDYKDDILDLTQNTQRKYRMITNADGTVSFEDVTVYSQVGDSFGAFELNQIANVVNEGSGNIDYFPDEDMIKIKDSEGNWHDYATGGLLYGDLIPTLTSYTGDNGTCIYSSELSADYRIWYAFDYGDSTVGATANATTNYIGYEWNNKIKAKGVEAGFVFLHGEAKTITFKLQYYDGSEWVDIADSEKTHSFSVQNTSIQLNWSLPDYINTNGIRIYSTCSSGHVAGYYNIRVLGKK